MNKSEIYLKGGFKWCAPLLIAALATGCGGGGGGRDPILGANVASVILVPPVNAIAPGAVCPVAGPSVTTTDPANASPAESTSTAGVSNSGKLVTATFSEAMKATTINATTFQLAPNGGVVLVPASVTYNILTNVATLTTASALTPNTNYTAVIQGPVTNGASTPIGCSYVWTFKTAVAVAVGVPPAPPPISILKTAGRYGTFGGTAGMTNHGNLTRITGSNGATADIGTIATGTSSITGFHDSAPSDIYSEVPGVDVGNVTGKIYTCTNSTTGPTSATNVAPDTKNPASCAIATQARLDAEQAYLTLAGMPPSGVAAPANLGSQTLAPGVYKATSGSFLIQGGDLTLDANGKADAIWVFQMASSLTVGGADAASSRSIILTNGALAKNVFWQVGSSAIINAAGGGTMVGTIISQAGAAFSTAGSVLPLNLNGRALSLGASVTLVNTLINVPAP